MGDPIGIPICKIGDFGVSSLFEGDDDRLNNTVGSAGFMAPEMCLGVKDFSGKKADIWSLGVTLFSFIFGRLPFVART
ncbi:protein kinase domain-containing protein, partial [Klebsiella pneumoniae]|uniref:protein kinase domain-containing protein n=1 Tax=Klebsiella pneumoniae TaxID=573 RepID=UPI003CFDB8F6